jgi:hypothetical protein
MRGRRGFQRAIELYTDSWDRSMVHQRWTRLGFVGGSLGRHRALSLGVQMAVSVASWLGSYVSGFRAEAGEVVHSVVGSVGCGAGQGCRHDGGLMPCRRVCSARPGGVQVHGNTSPTLRMLGGTVASGWHGRGAVYGGSEVAASRGIGRGRAGEFNGEVTGREVVGGALPRLGVHGGQWRRPWHRRGIVVGLCGVGSGEGSYRDGACSLGVYGGGGDRREGSMGRVPSGSSSSPRCQVNRTSRKDF